MSKKSIHDSQEGFNWSLEGLPDDQLIAIQAAVDAADAAFSAEIGRIQAAAFKASQRATDKLRKRKAEIYYPYRIRASQNPQEKMTASMREVLEDVTANGPQNYNGLMEKPIRALERMGLVTVSYDFFPAAHGRGRRVFTVGVKS